MMCRLLSRLICSLFIFLLLFLIIRAPLFAQSAGLVLHEVNVDSFPTMNLIVSAWNGSQPITNLSVDDFTLIEDGQMTPIQEVTSLDSSQVPISLILVLDTSTSMQANNAINDAKAAAFSILDRLKPNDRVALLAFAGEIDRNLDVLDQTRELAFTTDKEEVRAVITGLQADGPTPLYDATVKAIRLSANEAAGSRAMILLTDGRDEKLIDEVSVPASVLTADDAINAVRDTSMPIFTIGLGNSIDQPFLQRLADQSEGTFASVPTPDQLNVQFNQAFDRLLQRYVISYQSNGLPNEESHALLVELNKNGQSASGQDTFIAPLPDQPVISLNYEENQQVQGDVTIEPTILARDAILNVQLLVDGEVVDESNSEPYALIWRSGDARWLQPPNHTITVQVTDEGGDVGEQSVPLVVVAPASIPSEEPVATEPTATVMATGSRDEASVSPEASPVSPEAEAEAEGAGVVPSPLNLVRNNWLPLSLLALAGLLFIGVLFIWMRDRRHRSSYKVADNLPLPPRPTPEPFSAEPLRTDVSEQGELYSQISSFPVYADEKKTELDSSQSLSTDSATALLNHTTAADEPLEKTVILGKKPRLASLMVMEGADKGKTFNISEEKVTIGRGGREIEVEIALSDRTVSREQAAIKLENDAYFLYNLSRSNLTSINGQEVKGRIQLHDRDKIEMGNTTLQFIDL